MLSLMEQIVNKKEEIELLYDKKGELLKKYRIKELPDGMSKWRILAGWREDKDDLTFFKDVKKGSKNRVLVNAVQIDAVNTNTPCILSLPNSVFDDVISVIQEWGDITQLETGKDLIFTRLDSKNWGDYEYEVKVARKSAPLPSDIMLKIFNLDDYENACKK